MFKWFKRSTLDPLSVTMVGVKLADRVLVIGCGDPRLIAALAAKSGLTGRTCAVDRSESVVREAERVTLAEGALAEFGVVTSPALPYDAGAFDVVVLRDVMRTADADERRAIGAESSRVVRPGGRCMVIDGQGPAKSWAFERRPPANPAAAQELTDVLMAVGFVAVRELAEREGLLFLEAVKRA
jgi:ubiquinone/menaquinone biosynthesis C-methylase UbiE